MATLAEIIDMQIKKRISQISIVDTATVAAVDGQKATIDAIVHGAGNTLQLHDVTVIQPSAQSGTSGSGIYAMPRVGDQVLILYLEPGKAAPIAIGTYYDTIENDTAFETDVNKWNFKHPSGSKIEFLSTGDIKVSSSGGAYILLEANGDITLNAKTGRNLYMQRS